jgi:prepilin-type N-terminal cleavage/methylation domain-containing protein
MLMLMSRATKSHNRPKNKKQTGFTLSEVLIVLAIMGIIAVMLVPKLVNNTANQTGTAVVKDIFHNTGELFLRRQNDPNLPDVAWGNEAATYQAYMMSHMTGQPCDAAEGCLMKFATGGRIISVADESVTPIGSGAPVNAVVVTLDTPKTDEFKVVIAPPAADPTGPATRYSTMFGITGNEEVAEVEAMLKTQ